jgi:hypothetical protein
MARHDRMAYRRALAMQTHLTPRARYPRQSRRGRTNVSARAQAEPARGRGEVGLARQQKSHRRIPVACVVPGLVPAYRPQLPRVLVRSACFIQTEVLEEPMVVGNRYQIAPSFARATTEAETVAGAVVKPRTVWLG